MSSSRTVAHLGEEGVIALVHERFPAPAHVTGIGDDAAVFPSPGATLVFTTDTMVEGVDFDLSYASGRDLGWKVVAINVSDVAAMGGRPTQAVATLCMPRNTLVAVVEGVVDGMAAAAAEWNVQVVGGDLSSGTSVAIGIALLGYVESVVLRSGATAGDGIYVTGALGGSAAGLAQLRADAAATGSLVDRHLRPRARLEEGTRLRAAGATAMIDVSDGFVVDLERLLNASDVGCEVDLSSIPVDPELSLAPIDGTRAALFGGEDFELLFTIPAARVEDARARLAELGTEISRVGTVTAGPQRIGSDELASLKEETWDHLRRP